jgi:hypothetical protein
MLRLKRGLLIAVLVGAIATLGGMFQQANAYRFSSTNYTIDASVGNSFGGSNSSTNYKLVGSGGESVIGNGSGGSYKLGVGYVAQLDKSLQIAVQPSGLVAYFPLEEGAGSNVWDSSANSNNGTGTNNTWTTGKIGGALAMNGSNRYVNVPDSTSLNPTNITVSAWLNSSDTATTASAVTKWDDVTQGDGEWILGHGATAGTFRFLIKIGGTIYRNESSTGFSTGTFHHVVGTYDGSYVRLYVDGAEVGTALAASGSMPSTLPPVRLGTRASNNQYYNGIVDEVKIFSRALSAKEIKAEYDAGNAGNTAGASLSTITAGTSQTAKLDAIVQTDAAGYTLAVNQNQNLTSGANTIPAVSCSIASPITWSEGSTKGLGFTLYGTNATALPGTWSSGSAYAAFPASATSFYTRTGYTGGTKDVINIRLRADVNVTQAVGDYTNTVTWTGTAAP